MRARTPGWVVGVLVLVLALLFGAAVGVPASHSAFSHQLITPGHRDHGTWSGGDGDERQPLAMHAEGEQVETPEATGHAFTQVTAGIVAQLVAAPRLAPFAGAHTDHAPVRSALQIWRT